MNAFAIAGRIVGYALAGAAVLPLVLLIPMIVIYMVDSRCGTPGDSGGCEMGIASLMIGAVPVGAALGIALAIWRSVRRRVS